ncbi:endonuclease/exonuclease/phosphatase family protein [Salinibacterium sp. dk5596]|uniref:endonuclease/exonuclease/phosphatase family protein n=1 Tax=Salinibacterium sp. dk5596 TaxID=2603291 RepID=UPI00351AA8A4
MLAPHLQNDAAVIGPVAPPAVHIMSWNIRRTIAGTRKNSPDFWPTRRPLVERLLRAEAPTIIGVQEAMLRQADDLTEMLGSDYRRVGRGRRADGRGEGCPVFYDTSRVELTAWSQFALSPTPTVAGSRGWGNMVPRVVVQAKFRTLAGARFGLLNVHLDHLSRRSRRRSADLLASLAQRSPRPAIVMGDFNDVPGSATYRALQGAGLVDTLERARERRGRDVGTYSGYKAPKANDPRIDWMLATPELQVLVAAINSSRFEGRAPSDHEPIQSVIEIP